MKRPNYTDIWTIQTILYREYQQYTAYKISQALPNDFRIHSWTEATQCNNIRMDSKFQKGNDQIMNVQKKS